jgi:hypothetical protein
MLLCRSLLLRVCYEGSGEVTQHNDTLTHCVLKCPVQDSRGGHSLGCGGRSLQGFEKDMCTVCSVRNLQTLDRPIVSNIIFGQYAENQSVSNMRARCPILREVFDRCTECTPEEAHVQLTILNVYVKSVVLISGRRLKLYTLAGSRSGVHLILKRLSKDLIDFCMMTTHVQNFSAPIQGFENEAQRIMVLCVLTELSEHLKSVCIEGGSIIDVAVKDPGLTFASFDMYLPTFTNHPVTIRHIIKALYCDKLQDCLLERVLDDFALKSHLDGLIHRKMDDIVRYANESQPSKIYEPCEMTVRNLASWHGHLGNYARWVLGVRHPLTLLNQRFNAKQRICSHPDCSNVVVNSRVCFQHGAKCWGLGGGAKSLV